MLRQSSTAVSETSEIPIKSEYPIFRKGTRSDCGSGNNKHGKWAKPSDEPVGPGWYPEGIPDIQYRIRCANRDMYTYILTVGALRVP